VVVKGAATLVAVDAGAVGEGGVEDTVATDAVGGGLGAGAEEDAEARAGGGLASDVAFASKTEAASTSTKDARGRNALKSACFMRGTISEGGFGVRPEDRDAV
jgi:hypothetical protein